MKAPASRILCPTESENKRELDRFCEALIAIREEIAAIERGEAERDNNALRNAPHTRRLLMQEQWDPPYTREQAFFPLEWIHEGKYWPPVGRSNEAHSDRNLVCTCPPMNAYE